MGDSYFELRGGDPAGGRPGPDTGRSRLHRRVLAGVRPGRRLLRQMNRFRAARLGARRRDLVAIVPLAASFCEREREIEKGSTMKDVARGLSFAPRVSLSRQDSAPIYYLIPRPSIAPSLDPRSTWSSGPFAAARELETCQAYRRAPRCYCPCAVKSRTVSG